MPDQEALDACLRRGALAYQSGRWEEAAREFERACGLNPSSAEAACELGRSLVRLKRLDEAVGRFEKALSIDPGHASALYHLALCLDTKGLLESALPAYERFLHSVPGDAKYVDKARKRVAELSSGQSQTSHQRDGTLTMGPAEQGTRTMGPEDQGTRTMGPADGGGTVGPGIGAVSDVAVAGWTVGSVVDDLYRIDGVLGEGGFGSVHKVRHLGWDMDLAVKSPREDKVSNRRAMERFVAEANTWVGLGFHPNVATCYFVRLMGGLPRIFIEYIEAGTLADWLRSRKIVDAKIAMDVCIQLARAMERVHGRGLIHRDLKPANCLMTPGGTLKVTDFGLAKAGQGEEGPEAEGELDDKAKHAKARETITTGGLGTPEYMAPEQWYHAGKATAAADVWAFGVMLCEIMHARPFRMAEDEPPDVFHFRLLEEKWRYKFREDAPQELKDIIASCLNPEPGNRKTPFGVLRSRLEALYASLFKEPYPRPAAKETPLLADTLSNQGVSLADLGHAEEALKLFSAALKQDPTHPGALYNQGVLRLKAAQQSAGDLVSQLEGVKRARAKEWAPAYLLGVARLAGRDKAAGLRDLKEAMLLSANPLIRRAMRLAESGRTESAMELFVSLPISAEAAASEEAEFNRLLAVARKEADAGSSAEAYKTLMKARAMRGRERAPLALALQQRLSSKARLKGLRAAWHKLSYADSANAVCAVVSPDGAQAFSGHEDGKVRVWDLGTGRLMHVLEGHRGRVSAVALTTEGAAALSSGQDGSLKVWALGTGTLVRSIATGHEGGAGPVFVLPEDKSAWTGGEDGTLKEWDLEGGREIRSTRAHQGPVHALSASPDHAHVLSAGPDGGFKLWDAKTGKLAHWAQIPGSVLGLAVAAGQRSAYLACSDGDLKKWCPNMGNRAVPVGASPFSGPARSVGLTPDERFALASGGRNELRLVDLRAGRAVWTSSEHKGRVNAACFSPDLRYALSAGEDGVFLWELDWELEFGGPEGAAAERSGPVFDLAEVPAGKPETRPSDKKAWLALAVMAGIAIAGLLVFGAYVAVFRGDNSLAPTQVFVARERPAPAQTPGPAPSATPNLDAFVKANQPSPEFQPKAEPAKPEPEIETSIDFPKDWARGGIDEKKLLARGKELERQGRLPGAYAAFMTAAELGNQEALDRKLALSRRLDKAQLVEAMGLARTIKDQGIAERSGWVRGRELRSLGQIRPEDMVMVPAGEFWMGSPDGEGSGAEHPRHKVYLDAYYMDKREVTNGEYMRFVRAAGSHEPEWMEAGSKYNVETGSDDHYKKLGEALRGDSYPVVGVSWHDAKAYCEWAGKRLPTEAEWEKAARGGAETKYHFGDSESELGEYAWYGSNSGGRTHLVGQKKPNQYGLYDMHGNVWEWVADWYDDKYYRNTPERNPTGPSSGSYRGLRGGAWDRDASYSRAAYRGRNSPGDRVSGGGFRCVRRQ